MAWTVHSTAVKFGTSVLHVNRGTSPYDSEELYRGFLSEHEKMFTEFKFFHTPCKNVYFAFKLIYTVKAVIENVKLEF